MKDHEIIGAIEKALDSATGEQRLRVEAWLRSRLEAKAEPEKTDEQKAREAKGQRAAEAIEEAVRRMREQPLPPPLTQPTPFYPWHQPIGIQPWWGTQDPPAWWRHETICEAPRLHMGAGYSRDEHGNVRHDLVLRTPHAGTTAEVVGKGFVGTSLRVVA